MPFYEYQCKACGHQLEALQKISDPALTQCPNCNKNELVKQVSAPAFHLKGSGWYVTDFKDKNKDGRQKASAEPAKEKADTKAADSKAKSGDTSKE